jgi:16S rRNA (adenine1518-N6/adenine1519-N6)-dimethyltransferase
VTSEEKIRASIDNLPPLREVINQNGLRAKKSLGQNFLLDLNLTKKIVKNAQPLSKNTIIEIGPGPGGLTRNLVKETATKKIIAIEYDQRAIKALEPLVTAAEGKLEIIHADALKTNILDIAKEKPISIVANLPYNIATPLLISWLKIIREQKDTIDNMTLMFQKEVAERIAAKPDNKNYGRLSIISSWLCDVRILFNVPKQAFTPPPKVTSSIVQLIPKENLDFENQPSFSTLEKITAQAFNQRRKKIRTSLNEYTHLFKELQIDENLRAENLPPEKYIQLAKLAEKEQPLKT